MTHASRAAAHPVIPKAGISGGHAEPFRREIPASAGMTITRASDAEVMP
jgi:hypothetical protein